MSSKIAYVFLIFLLIPLTASTQFKDINVNVGIKHSHVSPDLLGGGVGIIDINNDGLEDIYLTGGSYWDKIYLNKGNLQFQDISTESFVFQATRKTQTTGVSIGDINNDGFDDIFITTQKSRAPILLLNSGQNTFEDISIKAGLSTLTSWNMGAAMLDVNKDGYLDIYVTNYIEEFNAILDSINNLVGYDHTCAGNYLLINNGDNTFTNKANHYNVESIGCGLATAIVDINNDGSEDIIVANDFGEWIVPNEVFVFDNEKEIYEEQAVFHNLSDSIYGMGIAVGDYNNDNCPDFYFTNIGSNKFKVKTTSQSYSNLANNFNIENGKFNQLNTTGWGTVFLDFNNDTFEDIYVSNGFIRTADFIETSEEDPNKLYENINSESFQDISAGSDTDNTAKSRGVVKADLNNDGYPDLVCINIEPIRYKPESNTNVYINNSNDNNSLTVHLVGTSVNKNAFGAKVILYSGNKTFSKSLNSGGSHASSGSRKLIFGLGFIEVIDSIKVQWGDLSTATFKDIPVNKNIRITQNNSNAEILTCEISNWGCPIEDPLSNASPKMVSIYPNPASSIITIQDLLPEGAKYQIMNLSGDIIITGDTYLKTTINISDLAEGYYILLYRNNKHKFLIKHQ